MDTSGRIALVRLYRSVLRAHKNYLPQELKGLGDTYARDEFRRHKNAKPEFMKGFFHEWNSYLKQLQDLPPTSSTVGKDLDPAIVATMTDEQRAQLAALKEEAAKSFKRV